MHITFVKKRLASGEFCDKCQDVERRLTADGHFDRIDAVLIADEADPESQGMQLANAMDVERAPFFVVRDGDRTTVHTVYFKFVKEVLRSPVKASEAAVEILRDNPDLDFV